MIPQHSVLLKQTTIIKTASEVSRSRGPHTKGCTGGKINSPINFSSCVLRLGANTSSRWKLHYCCAMLVQYTNVYCSNWLLKLTDYLKKSRRCNFFAEGRVIVIDKKMGIILWIGLRGACQLRIHFFNESARLLRRRKHVINFYITNT